MSKKFFSIIMVISFVAAITACQSSIPEYVRSTLNGHSIQDVLVYMKGLPLDKRYDFYYCEARKPGVKEHIVDMAFNGADVRDTAKTLKIGINTVICTS